MPLVVPRAPSLESGAHGCLCPWAGECSGPCIRALLSEREWAMSGTHAEQATVSCGLLPVGCGPASAEPAPDQMGKGKGKRGQVQPSTCWVLCTLQAPNQESEGKGKKGQVPAPPLCESLDPKFHVQ